jgi:hypothetical protein
MQTRQHWDGRGSRRLECDPLIWRWSELSCYIRTYREPVYW